MLSNRVEVVLSGTLYLAVGTQSPIICSPQPLYFSPLLSGYPLLRPNGLFVLSSTCNERSVNKGTLNNTKNNISRQIESTFIPWYQCW